MFTAPFKVFIQAAKDVWDDKSNLILVNMVALVACVTVVFAPPAVFGLFYTANRLAAGESLGLTGLFQGGRKYFIQSWLWAILNIAIYLILSVNLSFYEQMPGFWGSVLQYFFLFVMIAWLLLQLYALPYFIEQEDNKLLPALRSAFFTLMASPGYSLVLMLLVIAVTLFSVALIVPLLLITPCLLACWGTRAVQERLVTLGVRKF